VKASWGKNATGARRGAAAASSAGPGGGAAAIPFGAGPSGQPGFGAAGAATAATAGIAVGPAGASAGTGGAAGAVYRLVSPGPAGGRPGGGAAQMVQQAALMHPGLGGGGAQMVQHLQAGPQVARLVQAPLGGALAGVQGGGVGLAGPSEVLMAGGYMTGQVRVCPCTRACVFCVRL
jgi:hypothetical protein